MLFAYFIISGYIAARATSFISLDVKAGVCREVPVAVSGLYSLDTSGHWSGDESYDPSSAIYSFRMNDFLKSTEEYRTYISEQKKIFKELGAKIKKFDFAQSLLHWMSWTHVTKDGTSKHSWQLSGDVKVVFDRPAHDGFVSGKRADCDIVPVTTYNPSTGKFKITYPFKKYNESSSCMSTISPANLGFDSRSGADTFDIKWDAVSHTTASAINSGVSTLKSDNELYFDTERENMKIIIFLLILNLSYLL